MNDSKKQPKELLIGKTKLSKFLTKMLVGVFIGFIIGCIIIFIDVYFKKKKIEHEREGALSGWFSISEETQVRFAKGNLQYNAALNKWRFAENQYDFVGKDNENVSPDYNGWIDLFGWGTSGWDCGSAYYRPYDTVMDSNYGPSEIGLGGIYDYSDWGCFNSIVNGGNDSAFWHTLDGPDWQYLLFYRHGMTYTYGIVHDVKGMLLFPDQWENPQGIAITKSKDCADNVFSVDQWNVLESEGVVFLPMAGSRIIGKYMGNDSLCSSWYWTSSIGIEMSVMDSVLGDVVSKAATSVFIQDHQDMPLVNPFTPRNTGASVRLVSRWVKVKKQKRED